MPEEYEQYDEEFRRKNPSLFRNYRDEPVTAETIKEEHERPFQNLAQGLATASKLGLAYQAARLSEYTRLRYQQFPFRGGDAPLVDVKATSPDYEGILNPILGASRFKEIPQGIGRNDPTVYIPPEELTDFQRTGVLESRPRINPSDARALKRFNSIFNNKLQYPSLEEMNFALKSKSKRKKGEFYFRPDKTTEKQWAVIGKRLQETYGGTDVELNDFIERQKLAKAKIESEIDIENRLYQMNYLSMALEMIDNDMLEGVENMEDLYGNPVAIQDVADFAYVQAVRMSQDPSKAQTMELGHIKAGRNIFDESKHLTTADYESNMRSEMKRSIRNWKHPKSKPLEIIKGKDAKGRTTYEFTGGHLVEAGNRARGSDQDLPDIMNLLMGTMPNVETEYMRFLGELGYAVAPKQAIPTPEHFVAYMRNRWRKYQGWGKSKLLGKQQLERFPKVLRMYINDYLNDLAEGKFLNTKGRADATDDMILDDRVGKGKERTPWEEKVIVDKLNDILGPDTHRP